MQEQLRNAKVASCSLVIMELNVVVEQNFEGPSFGDYNKRALLIIVVLSETNSDY